MPKQSKLSVPTKDAKTKTSVLTLRVETPLFDAVNQTCAELGVYRTDAIKTLLQALGDGTIRLVPRKEKE